jgi:hypothetical protein
VNNQQHGAGLVFYPSCANRIVHPSLYRCGPRRRDSVRPRTPAPPTQTKFHRVSAGSEGSSPHPIRNASRIYIVYYVTRVCRGLDVCRSDGHRRPRDEPLAAMPNDSSRVNAGHGNRYGGPLSTSHRPDPGLSVVVQHQDAEFGIGGEFRGPDGVAPQDLPGLSPGALSAGATRPGEAVL